MKLVLRRLPANAVGQFLGTDWAFGATAGIMIEPATGYHRWHLVTVRA